MARHFNQRSRLGTFIDPVADKMLMGCLALATGYTGLVHLPVAALIIGKDILMGLGFFGIAWFHGYRSTYQFSPFISSIEPKEMMQMIKSLEVKPSMLGKANTALQIALIILSICRPIWGIPSVQLFLPLEGIVSCTTVATLFSYAFTVNKSLKWSSPNIPQPLPTVEDCPSLENGESNNKKEEHAAGEGEGKQSS